LGFSSVVAGAASSLAGAALALPAFFLGALVAFFLWADFLDFSPSDNLKELFTGTSLPLLTPDERRTGKIKEGRETGRGVLRVVDLLAA